MKVTWDKGKLEIKVEMECAETRCGDMQQAGDKTNVIQYLVTEITKVIAGMLVCPTK